MTLIRTGYAAILLLATTLAVLVTFASPSAAGHFDEVPPPYEVDCNLRITLGAGCDVSVNSD
jgi:hypothetical protein